MGHMMCGIHNEAITDLMAENGNMKVLLLELIPEMEKRVEGLSDLYSDDYNINVLNKNKDILRRMKEFVKDFNIS